MKNILFTSIARLLIIVPLTLLPSCITDALEEINYFSGSWRIVFYDQNDNVVSGVGVAVQDDGTFCNQLNH